MNWKVRVDFETSSPGDPNQTQLELASKKKNRPQKNTLLEEAFAATREKVGLQPFRKLVVEKVEPK